MEPNAILLILIGLFVTSMIVYAIKPLPMTKNLFIGTAVIAFFVLHLYEN